jgi:hypothetical protein
VPLAQSYKEKEIRENIQVLSGGCVHPHWYVVLFTIVFPWCLSTFVGQIISLAFLIYVRFQVLLEILSPKLHWERA